MFKNIGGKIKTLAVIVFILEVIGVFFGAIWVAVEYYSILGALLTFGVGFVLAWISVFFIYGFGELIDRTTDIDKKLSMMVPAAVSHPPVHSVPVDCAPAPAVAPMQTAPVVAPPPAPAKPYYDIVVTNKSSVGAGKCPVCKQGNVELWECMLKEGNRYSQKSICKDCIATYKATSKQ